LPTIRYVSIVTIFGLAIGFSFPIKYPSIAQIPKHVPPPEADRQNQIISDMSFVVPGFWKKSLFCCKIFFRKNLDKVRNA